MTTATDIQPEYVTVRLHSNMYNIFISVNNFVTFEAKLLIY